MKQHHMEFNSVIAQMLSEMKEKKTEEHTNQETVFRIRTGKKKNAGIMYPFAFDASNNEIVYIENSDQKKSYICLDCKQSLIPRAMESEKRQAHFYHKSGEDRNCEESFEHYFVKNRIFSKLKEETGKEINLDLWYLMDEHQAQVNLMEDVAKVELEYNIMDKEGGIKARADVALLNKEDDILWVLEVVHTHNIEKETLEFYESSGISCIEIYVDNYVNHEILYYIGEPVPYYDGKVSEAIELRSREMSFDYKSRLIIRNKYSPPPKSKMLYSLTALLELNEGACYKVEDKVKFYLTGEDLLAVFSFLRGNQELINILIAQKRKEEREKNYEHEQFKELEVLWRSKQKKQKQLNLDDEAFNT